MKDENLNTGNYYFDKVNIPLQDQLQIFLRSDDDIQQICGHNLELNIVHSRFAAKKKRAWSQVTETMKILQQQ